MTSSEAPFITRLPNLRCPATSLFMRQDRPKTYGRAWSLLRSAPSSASEPPTTPSTPLPPLADSYPTSPNIVTFKQILPSCVSYVDLTPISAEINDLHGYQSVTLLRTRKSGPTIGSLERMLSPFASPFMKSREPFVGHIRGGGRGEQGCQIKGRINRRETRYLRLVYDLNGEPAAEYRSWALSEYCCASYLSGNLTSDNTTKESWRARTYGGRWFLALCVVRVLQ